MMMMMMMNIIMMLGIVDEHEFTFLVIVLRKNLSLFFAYFVSFYFLIFI